MKIFITINNLKVNYKRKHLLKLVFNINRELFSVPIIDKGDDEEEEKKKEKHEEGEAKEGEEKKENAF